jgi:hypothetical protein
MIQAITKANGSAEVELTDDTFQIWVKKGNKSIHLTFFENSNSPSEVDIVSWTPKGTKITKRSYKFGKGK